jgi:general secretion pathway protein J
MRDNSAGFALVQMLTSLVILGMLSLLLVQGVGVGRRVWDHVETHAAAAQSLASAQDALRNRLERAFPLTDYQSSPPYVDFEGDETVMTFLATPPDSGRPATLRQYDLRVTAGGDLLLSSVSDLAANTGAVQLDQTLLRGVQQLDLAYFGPIASDQVGRWRTNWNQQPGLPRLIRLRVTFPPGDPRQWPDLIIAPAATIDSECVLEVSTHRCRGRG